MAFFDRIRAFLHPNGITVADEKPQKKTFRGRVQRQYNYRVESDMKKYRQALQAAESPINPDRRELYTIYREVELDDQVECQKQIAVNTIHRAPFELEGADEMLLKTDWFLQYLQYAVETEFWGHSLLEFNPTMDEHGRFNDLLLLPRDHVRPEYGDIRLRTSDPVGEPYRDEKAWPYLVEIGRPFELGRYHVVAIPQIRKKYSDTDWSLFSEKFGMPFTIVRTSSRQKEELDEKENMLKNLGANGWAILDDQDEIEFTDAKGAAQPHMVFQDRIKLAESQISKIMNGQTGTSDEKAFVGAAQVHERILNDFTFARMAKIQNHVNMVLLPFLARHGYPTATAKFKFTELEPKPPIDPNADPNDGGTTGQKKNSLSYPMSRRSAAATT